MLNEQIKILEKAFDFFSKEKFDNALGNNNTVITIQSKGKLNCYGWCTIEPIWYKGKEEESEDGVTVYYEINLSAEYMNRDFYSIIETLLHEMVHLNNIFNRIEDCSSKQYHNEKFKAEAERIGLIVNKVKRYGWSETILSDELKELTDKFIKEYNINKYAFNIARKDKPVKKVIKRNKKIKMICNGCKKVISSDEALNITCNDCGEEFVVK